MGVNDGVFAYYPLARMSEKSYELLCKMFSAVPERTKEE